MATSSVFEGNGSQKTFDRNFEKKSCINIEKVEDFKKDS